MKQELGGVLLKRAYQYYTVCIHYDNMMNNNTRFHHCVLLLLCHKSSDHENHHQAVVSIIRFLASYCLETCDSYSCHHQYSLQSSILPQPYSTFPCYQLCRIGDSRAFCSLNSQPDHTYTYIQHKQEEKDDILAMKGICTNYQLCVASPFLHLIV